MNKKRCRHCKEYFEADSGITVPLGFFCCIEHAKEHGLSKAIAKKKKDATAKHRADKKELRQVRANSKRLIDYEREAQSAINAYVRARDHGKPCPSCERLFVEIAGKESWKIGGAFDCGHYLSRGSKPQLRFNLLNMASQCKTCNAGAGRFSAKNATVSQIYRINLIKRIGLERVEWLENNNERSKKDTLCRKDYIEYLERIKRIFRKRARYYKKRRGIGY